jgi:Fe2+ transport system protein FeoA
MSLSKLEPGSRAVIMDFIRGSADGPGSLIQRMMEMGLTIGAEVEVAHRAPFGGGIAVRCRGTLIALRLTDAEKIQVRSAT